MSVLVLPPEPFGLDVDPDDFDGVIGTLESVVPPTKAQVDVKEFKCDCSVATSTVEL